MNMKDKLSTLMYHKSKLSFQYNL